MNNLIALPTLTLCKNFIDNFETEDCINQAEIQNITRLLESELPSDLTRLSSIINAHAQRNIDFLLNKKNAIVDKCSKTAISATVLLGITTVSCHLAKYFLKIPPQAVELCNAVGYMGINKTCDVAKNIRNTDLNNEKRKLIEKDVFNIGERLALLNNKVTKICQDRRERSLVSLEERVNNTLSALNERYGIAE